jgi:hypothetical protein
LHGWTPYCRRQLTFSWIHDSRVLSFLFCLRTAARLHYPTPLSSSYNRDLCCFYGLKNSWIGLSLRRSVAGGRLIQLSPCGEYCGFHFMLDGILHLRLESTECGSHFFLTRYNFLSYFL